MVRQFWYGLRLREDVKKKIHFCSLINSCFLKPSSSFTQHLDFPQRTNGLVTCSDVDSYLQVALLLTAMRTHKGFRFSPNVSGNAYALVAAELSTGSFWFYCRCGHQRGIWLWRISSIGCGTVLCTTVSHGWVSDTNYEGISSMAVASPFQRGYLDSMSFSYFY